MTSINGKHFLIFIVINSVIYLTCAGLITTDNLENRMVKRPMASSASTSSASSPFDESSEISRKNDDAHLRLYYKSNSPGRSVSHELEHRFVKNPAFQYNQRLRQEANGFQPKFNTQLDLNYYDPRNNLLSNLPLNQNLNNNQNMFYDANKNKQTMFNLHYHGNSLDGLDSGYVTQQQQQQQQDAQLNGVQNQQKNLKANLLKMLLLNQQIQRQQQQQQQQHQQSLMQQSQLHQPQFEQFNNDQSKNENGLQYKIVHLKFKIEPQYGSKRNIP